MGKDIELAVALQPKTGALILKERRMVRAIDVCWVIECGEPISNPEPVLVARGLDIEAVHVPHPPAGYGNDAGPAIFMEGHFKMGFFGLGVVEFVFQGIVADAAGIVCDRNRMAGRTVIPSYV